MLDNQKINVKFASKAHAFSSFFKDIDGGNLIVPHKTMRVIQTTMTDSELAKRNLGIVVGDDGVSKMYDFTDSQSMRLFKDNLIPSAEPTKSYNRWKRRAPTWTKKFSARISELKSLAIEDDIQINLASVDAAEVFLGSEPFIKLPSVFLLNNGNVRLLWTNGKQEQVGLQFQGTTKVQYVIFVMRDGVMAESMGVDTIAGLKRLLNDPDVKLITSR
jgi:hypothetical protein